MSYREFTLRRVKADFGLTLIEGQRFLPEIVPVAPTSPYLQDFLTETLPLAIAMGSEKARSELLVSPILVELRRIFDRKISFFSGEEFNVDAAIGLNGVCDFLISRSPEQLILEAPAVVIVEAKKDNIKSSFGQPATQGSEETSEQSVAVCIAEMIAAQRFNQEAGQPIQTIYGTVTTGNIWTFLQLQGGVVTIDLRARLKSLAKKLPKLYAVDEIKKYYSTKPWEQDNFTLQI